MVFGMFFINKFEVLLFKSYIFLVFSESDFTFIEVKYYISLQSFINTCLPLYASGSQDDPIGS